MPAPRFSEGYMGSQGWVVRDAQEGRYITGVSKDEAHIIAFALNAVAEGAVLSRGQEMISEGRNAYAEYDGPTEGVAP